MLEFKKITLNDKAWVDEIVFAQNSRSADFNFGNIYIWDKTYKQLAAKHNDRMITKIRINGKSAFAFPIGSGDLSLTIKELKSFADMRGYPLIIKGIEEENISLLNSLFPGKFEFTETEESADYIYLAEKLSTYSGKALHGKKNHCNHFEKEFQDWEFVPITRSLIPRCLDMLLYWEETNSARLDEGIEDEHDAIIRAFAAYEKLELEGGALIAGGKLLGFSIGEMCSSDCFNVHFEKADISINGAYPMVCREMVKLAMSSHPELVYINREDDVGLPSLRASKLSYKPEYLLKKYIGQWID